MKFLFAFPIDTMRFLQGRLNMTDFSKGLVAAVASNLLFFMLFLYGTWMHPMTGTEVFAWRMVAMLAAICVLMGMSDGWKVAGQFVRETGRDWKRWFWIMLPTPVFASQLWLFVWSPVNGEGVNVAMGYFLFPLAMLACGRIWFKETLNRLQIVAVVSACLGVAWELVRSGAFSWATVWVFGTYPIYYLVRRKLGVPALIGLTFDLLVIAPCALFYILTQTDTINLIASTPKLIGFIVLLGINSAVAMHLNLKASQLLPIAVFGMLSYLEPVLLFIISIAWLSEPLESGALISYGFIWLGLSLMMVNGWLAMKRRVV